MERFPILIRQTTKTVKLLISFYFHCYSFPHPPNFFSFFQKSPGHVIIGTKTNPNISLKHRASSVPPHPHLGMQPVHTFWNNCSLIPKHFPWHHREMVRKMSSGASHTLRLQIKDSCDLTQTPDCYFYYSQPQVTKVKRQNDTNLEILRGKKKNKECVLVIVGSRQIIIFLQSNQNAIITYWVTKWVFTH